MGPLSMREEIHGRRTCDRNLRDFDLELRGRHPPGPRAGHKDPAGVTAASIKDQRVKLENGQIAEYQVNMEVTFVLEG